MEILLEAGDASVSSVYSVLIASNKKTPQSAPRFVENDLLVRIHD